MRVRESILYIHRSLSSFPLFFSAPQWNIRKVLIHILGLYVVNVMIFVFCLSREDKFNVVAPDLGILTKMTVRHNNQGFGAAWYLEKVIPNINRPIFRFLRHFERLSGYLH
jgi:hypothetical protein